MSRFLRFVFKIRFEYFLSLVGFDIYKNYKKIVVVVVELVVVMSLINPSIAQPISILIAVFRARPASHFTPGYREASGVKHLAHTYKM